MSSYLYGITDEKYVRESMLSSSDVNREKAINLGTSSFKYRTPALLKGPETFDPNDISIVYKTSPESLLNLAIKVIDAMPLPSVYTWTIEDICRWLRANGYSQYQHTFRENYINGRSLLLLDASALSAMNIKDFEHIRHLAHGIRSLYFFELTKFGRSITLAPDFHYELYKLYRVKNGTKYDNTKRSELWRRMQLIREQRKYRDHWDTLDSWLKMEKEPKYNELFGEIIRRKNLYRCKQPKEPSSSLHLPTAAAAVTLCQCMPPCDCYWSERNLRQPWVLSNVPATRNSVRRESVLTILQNIFPHKYGPIIQETHEANHNSNSVHKLKANKTSNTFIV